MPSRSRRAPSRDPLLLEIAAAIGAGNLEFGPIHCDREFVHGVAYTKTGRIRVNPAPDVCDTLLHETIHRLRPSWGERAVRAKVTQIMRQMSMAEVDKLYEIALSSARICKKVEQL